MTLFSSGKKYAEPMVFQDAWYYYLQNQTCFWLDQGITCQGITCARVLLEPFLRLCWLDSSALWNCDQNEFSVDCFRLSRSTNAWVVLILSLGRTDDQGGTLPTATSPILACPLTGRWAQCPPGGECFIADRYHGSPSRTTKTSVTP